MQPAVSIPKEKDRHEGGLAARGFHPKAKKIDKKEGLQPAGSILEKKEGLQLAGSIPKEEDRHEGGLAAVASPTCFGSVFLILFRVIVEEYVRSSYGGW